MRTSKRLQLGAGLVAGLLAPALVALSTAHAAEDPFAAGVRATDPLSPTDQQKKFKLPPGFEIQLVANEPDIHKPMNLAFDSRGRLWVTTSIEYPFAAPTNRPGRDRVMIFEDFGPDGRARKVTTFASGLNIPIGVYPFHSRNSDGASTWKAIVWSIPNLWLFEDTDDDGRSDRFEKLYGPFDHTRDTHGNQASFRRGFDGWLYCTHGFNNDSRVTGADGHGVHLNSGNTYRIQLDGRRIEQHTWGQVNPFGAAFDPVGNLYTSDCHSAPIYQLLAGGYYPSFGKPHDGLGFAPVLMEHAHGSTAIDGLSYYSDNLWPDEFRDNIFIGNVMTSRLNRDRIESKGASPVAVELPDFVQTDDPWFRPVDTCLGPDGALYIADFYNRIIGHYEVPLLHPGRDRERGRLWRVVYRNPNGAPQLHARNIDLSRAPAETLIAQLNDPSLSWRTLAINELLDRVGASAGPALERFASENSASPSGRAHALWALFRIGRLQNGLLDAATRDADRSVRIHAQRIIAEFQRLKNIGWLTAASTAHLPALAQRGLSDPDPLVQRCAAEALGVMPHFDNVRPLLRLRRQVPPADTHLTYTVRQALRNQLQHDDTFAAVLNASWQEAELRDLVDVAVAVKSTHAGTFLGRNLAHVPTDRPSLTAALQHVARYAPAQEIDGLADFVKSRFNRDLDFQLSLINSVAAGAAQRGSSLSAPLQQWATDLARQALSAQADSTWWNRSLDANPTPSPWAYQTRRDSQGRDVRVLSSLPGGESLTGALRSRTFPAPAKLEFLLAGHDGPPDKPALKNNAARLRDAQSDQILAEAWAPRTDVARLVSWDLSAHSGKSVYLEVTDADTGAAYAWIAIGQLDSAAPQLPEPGPGDLTRLQRTGAELATRVRAASLNPELSRIALSAQADPEARVAAARALLALDAPASLPLLAPLVANPGLDVALRASLGELLAEQKLPFALKTVVEAMKSAPFRVQQRWAPLLAESTAGGEALLDAIAQGAAAPRLLQSVGVKNRLQNSKPKDWENRIRILTQSLVPATEARDKLIADRRQSFTAKGGRADDGKRIFATHCAPCHQLDGVGALIGPQLTGIGNRGLERLCEDILDPNRNVDHAFRQTLLTLRDNETVTGLFRREEGNQLVLADGAGREFSVKKSDVQERRELESSPMPESFGESIPEGDLNHLLAYLLAQRGRN